MRDDISDKLVHLTKGTSEDTARHREEARNTLMQILRQQTLLGSNGFIRGGHRCICFSEAPISKLSHMLAFRELGRFKYQPYGVIFDKEFIYRSSGRPVIYGHDTEYEQLPDDMKYRHVRLDLSGPYPIDFSWEREWRLKLGAFAFSPGVASIILPDRIMKDHFVLSGFSQWHYIVLSDLGVKVDRD